MLLIAIVVTIYQFEFLSHADVQVIADKYVSRLNIGITIVQRISESIHFVIKKHFGRRHGGFWPPPGGSRFGSQNAQRRPGEFFCKFYLKNRFVVKKHFGRRHGGFWPPPGGS